jgi:hypothetical protein
MKPEYSFYTYFIAMIWVLIAVGLVVFTEVSFSVTDTILLAILFMLIAIFLRLRENRRYYR